MSDKYCVKCKHYKSYSGKPDVCMRDVRFKVNLVTGKREPVNEEQAAHRCETQRTKDNNPFYDKRKCSEEGKFFEPRPTTDRVFKQ